MSERRRSLRAPIELNVEYKRLNTFFADYTRNISQGGTFIRTDRPLEKNTEFVFALSIRGLDEPLRLRGRVKWIVSTDEATADSPAGMGIEFQYADEAERGATEAVVRELMDRELGEDLSDKLLGRRVGPPTAGDPTAGDPTAGDPTAGDPASSGSEE